MTYDLRRRKCYKCRGTVLFSACGSLLFDLSLKNIQEEGFCQAQTNRCVNYIWAGFTLQHIPDSVTEVCLGSGKSLEKLAFGSSSTPPLPPSSILPGDSVNILLLPVSALYGSCLKVCQIVIFLILSSSRLFWFIITFPFPLTDFFFVSYFAAIVLPPCQAF